MGIQTDAVEPAGLHRHRGERQRSRRHGRELATEAYQATYYKQMLQLLSCDPNVRVINFFHLVDEPNLAGWQSGLYWVGRPDADREAVRRRRRGLAHPDRRQVPGEDGALEAGATTSAGRYEEVV